MNPKLELLVRLVFDRRISFIKESIIMYSSYKSSFELDEELILMELVRQSEILHKLYSELLENTEGKYKYSPLSSESIASGARFSFTVCLERKNRSKTEDNYMNEIPLNNPISHVVFSSFEDAYLGDKISDLIEQISLIANFKEEES